MKKELQNGVVEEVKVSEDMVSGEVVSGAVVSGAVVSKDKISGQVVNKRGRGRPRKISEVDLAVVDKKNEEVDKVSGDGVNERGKGNPTKISEGDVSVVEEPKRKRGRPRKNTTRVDDSNDVTGQLPRRKRGRPRKTGTTPISLDMNTTAIDSLAALIQKLESQKIDLSYNTKNIELLPNLSMQQKILIRILKKMLAEAYSVKGMRDIKLL